MKVDGPIYTTLLESAERQKHPYDAKQQQVMRDTVEELAKGSTSAARPGMLLGRIQSGKTKTFLGIIALAADNGYDLIIVLTKGTKALTEQTLERLKQSYADSINDDLLRVFDIMAFPSKLTKDEQKRPIIIIAKKQARNLERLDTLLFETYSHLGERKTLFIDDEADFASIGFKKKDEEGFAELQKIMSQIDKLRSKLKHSSFLQVTATPYSLYLQPRDTVNKNGELYQPIRPSFTQLVPTHSAYVGGDFYFEHGDDPKHVGSYVYVPVDLDELEILEGEDRRRFKIEEALTSPKIQSLRRAIVSFAIGGTIRRLQSKLAKQPVGRYSFVIHTKAGRATHAWQVTVSEVLVEKLIEAAENGSEIFKSLAKAAYDDFAPSIGATGGVLPPFHDVLDAAISNVAKIQIEKVNSDTDVRALLDANGQLELRNALNIFIGGSILDRGLTIDSLIGFYYGRRANRFQQDTVLQHHRMYGARPIADMAVTRFYTTQSLYDTLRTIHDFDATLRGSIGSGDGQPIAFIRKQGQQIIPCSPNKILASDVTSLRSGKRLLPVGFQTKYKTHAMPTLKKLDALIDSLVKSEVNAPAVLINLLQAGEILDMAIEIIDKDASEMGFNLDAVKASLRYVCHQNPDEKLREKMYLLVRKDRANVRQRESGRFFDAPDTSHIEGAIAKGTAVNLPMLMLFRQKGSEEQGWRGCPFYWPVVYMPQQMGTVIFANDVNDFDEDEIVPAGD